MSDPEKEAEELLPYHPQFYGGDAFYRRLVSAVAAALRKRDEQIERLQKFQYHVDNWCKRTEPKIDKAIETFESLKSQLAAAEGEIEQIRTYGNGYTGNEARPCPFCIWDNGKLIEKCGFHGEIERLQTEKGQLIADLMGSRDGALVRDLRGWLTDAEKEADKLRAEIEEYKKK